MADFERSTTVGVGADAAFAFLADPQRLPEYVATMTHVDSTAVDGKLVVEAEVEGRQEAGVAHFFADAAARRIEWGRPGTDYAGSATVTPGTSSTSQVTIRLHTRGDANAPEIDRVLDQTMRNLQRLLSGR
jgi:hypothetical protein